VKQYSLTKRLRNLFGFRIKKKARGLQSNDVVENIWSIHVGIVYF